MRPRVRPQARQYKQAVTHSFDALAVATLSKAINKSAGELPKSLLVTFLSKDRSTGRIPKFR